MDDDLIASWQNSEVITESTAIDDQAGLLMWWRHVESRGVKLVGMGTQSLVFECV